MIIKSKIKQCCDKTYNFEFKLDGPTSTNEFTDAILIACLKATQGNVTRTAKFLKITRQTVYNRMAALYPTEL